MVKARLHQASVSTLRQLCNDTSDSVLIETMELLENGVATYFQAIPLLSMRRELLASLQSCYSIDVDV